LNGKELFFLNLLTMKNLNLTISFLFYLFFSTGINPIIIFLTFKLY